MTAREASFDTARLRALAEKATPGKRAVAGTRILVDDVLGVQTSGPNWRNDQAYIAAADPQTLLALLDEIERLRAWKEEALIVLAAWEGTWIAAGRPGQLGASKAMSVFEEIVRLRGDTEWEYYATARKGHVAGEPRVHERGAIQAYEEALDQVVFEQEDETPVVFKRRAAGPWEPVEGDTLARHARDSGA